jgi:hypothetical protein
MKHQDLRAVQFREAEMKVSLSGDLLTGAQAIADELGWKNRRKVYDQVERGTGWPIWVEGGIIYSSRSALRRFIEIRAQEAMNRVSGPITKGQRADGDRHQDDMAA